MNSFWLLYTVFVAFFMVAFGEDEVSTASNVLTFETTEEFNKFLEEHNIGGPSKEASKLFEQSSFKTAGTLRGRSIDIASSGINFGYPTFSSSFIAQDKKKYKYKMVGYPPKSGKTAKIPVTIVPMKLTLKGFSEIPDNFVLDPAAAVENVKGSPLFKSTSFKGVGGDTQYVDAVQRCSFWNEMDKKRNWKVLLNQPKVAKNWNLVLTPANASAYAVTTNGVVSPAKTAVNIYEGTMMDALLGYMNSGRVKVGELIIFQCYNCYSSGAAGFHNYYTFGPHDAVATIFSGWNDPELQSPYKDILILSHELAEWANDPLGDNPVPNWKFNPHSHPNAVCSDYPYLEVGDPVTNCEYCAYKRDSPVKVNGKTYHPQNVVMWQWFAGNKTSNTCNKGWTYPDKIYTNSARLC